MASCKSEIVTIDKQEYLKNGDPDVSNPKSNLVYYLRIRLKTGGNWKVLKEKNPFDGIIRLCEVVRS